MQPSDKKIPKGIIRVDNGRLFPLQVWYYWGLLLLAAIDAHEHVAVAGQAALVCLCHVAALGPVFDKHNQLPGWSTTVVNNGGH